MKIIRLTRGGQPATLSVVLRRPAPRGAYNRVREEHIAQLHPLLAQLRPSLLSSLDLIDDYGESDRFDVVLKLLPTVNAPYLPFDAALIDDLLAHFGCDGATETSQVLPSYWSEWQNARTYYLFQTTGKIAVRELTFIRIRRDAGEAPRLDDMIWMGHEVAHHLLAQQATVVTELFQPAWLTYQTERIMSQHARGGAEARAQELAARMAQFWGADSRDSNWMHELTIDALCLWVFGPAYLWAFVQEHIDEPESYEAHQLDMHPPRRLRAEAMQQAAMALGWAQAADLDGLLRAWQPAPADASAANTYRAFYRSYLVEGTRKVAFELARQLNIPQLNPEEWAQIIPEQAVSTDITARDLILAAWTLRAADCTLGTLETWEQAVVSTTLSAVADGG